MRNLILVSVLCVVTSTASAQELATPFMAGTCTSAEDANCRHILNEPCRTETPNRRSIETVNQDCFVKRYGTVDIAKTVESMPKTHICYIIRKSITGIAPFEVERLLVQAEECVD